MAPTIWFTEAPQKHHMIWVGAEWGKKPEKPLFNECDKPGGVSPNTDILMSRGLNFQLNPKRHSL